MGEILETKMKMRNKFGRKILPERGRGNITFCKCKMVEAGGIEPPSA